MSESKLFCYVMKNKFLKAFQQYTLSVIIALCRLAFVFRMHLCLQVITLHIARLLRPVGLKEPESCFCMRVWIEVVWLNIGILVTSSCDHGTETLRSIKSRDFF